MGFSQIKGYDDVCLALKGMVDSGKIPHAIMFHEDDGGGAMQVVLAFLQYLYCKNHSGGDSCGECPSCNKIRKLIHPDVHFVFPVNTAYCADYLDKWRCLVSANPFFTENDLNEALEIEGKSSMIKVDEAKRLMDVLSLSALEKGYRSVVIYLPEKLNQVAANRLLKLIEEPPALTEFILITHAPEKVLVTIASRCQNIRLVPQGVKSQVSDYSQESELLRSLMQALLAKDLYACLEVAESLSVLPSKEKAKNFCKFAAEGIRYVFLIQQGVSELVDVDQTRLREYSDWAARSRKTFPRKALECFSRAQMLISRNVNMKILFTDMVNGLYVNI